MMMLRFSIEAQCLPQFNLRALIKNDDLAQDLDSRHGSHKREREQDDGQVTKDRDEGEVVVYQQNAHNPEASALRCYHIFIVGLTIRTFLFAAIHHGNSLFILKISVVVWVSIGRFIGLNIGVCLLVVQNAPEYKLCPWFLFVPSRSKCKKLDTEKLFVYRNHTVAEIFDSIAENFADFNFKEPSIQIPPSFVTDSLLSPPGLYKKTAIFSVLSW
ncbi:hypothetical protein EAE99_004021 [Botrytis elliptica]|nr:hypothetical protein EAE99_004021 [Botrytis elliptica]